MKKYLLLISKGIALCSFVFALFNANSACAFIYHQPELPDKVSSGWAARMAANTSCRLRPLATAVMLSAASCWARDMLIFLYFLVAIVFSISDGILIVKYRLK